MSEGPRPQGPPKRKAPGAFDRVPVPQGIEDASEAAWRDYEACCTALDRRLAQLRSSAAAQARELIRRAARPSGQRAPALRGPRRIVTVAQVLQLVRANGRVCPRPGPWHCVYLLLPEAREDDHAERAPLPVTFAAWEHTPDLRKRLALRAQIDWAQRHGALVRLYDCLAALREQDWHHLPLMASPPGVRGLRD